MKTGICIQVKPFEEKISFSDRFGLWLSFYPYSQDEYLFIMAHWLRSFGCTEDQISAATQEALQWALHRGSRSRKNGMAICP